MTLCSFIDTSVSGLVSEYPQGSAHMNRFRASIGSGPNSMSRNRRVLNITTGERPKISQAEKRIADGLLAWVAKGETVRNLTLAESIAARNEIAKNAEPLESAELPGVVFVPPMSAMEYRASHPDILRETREFAMGNG